MEIKVHRIKKQINPSEIMGVYSIEPKLEKYEYALAVISNWKKPKDLVRLAINKIGYCDTDNGFGITYKNEIDFETQLKVPEDSILVSAEYLTTKEFVVTELEYLKILSQFLISNKEAEYAKTIENLLK